MIKIVIVLSIASLLVFAALLAAPVVFGVVATVSVSIAMLVSIYQIVTSAPRYQAPDHRVAASVDGVPVKSVEVMP